MRHKPGPSGTFSQGKLDPTDRGDLTLAVTIQANTVRIDFGTPVAWVGFNPESARALAASLIARADEIEGKGS